MSKFTREQRIAAPRPAIGEDPRPGGIQVDRRGGLTEHRRVVDERLPWSMDVTGCGHGAAFRACFPLGKMA